MLAQCVGSLQTRADARFYLARCCCLSGSDGLAGQGVATTPKVKDPSAHAEAADGTSTVAHSPPQHTPQGVDVSQDKAFGQTIVDELRQQAAAHADRILFSWHDTSEQYTYEQFHNITSGLAVQLLQTTASGERVVLLYPSGLQSLVSLMACLKAGIIPVLVDYPSEPADTAQSIAELLGIAKVSGRTRFMLCQNVHSCVHLHLAVSSCSPYPSGLRCNCPADDSLLPQLTAVSSCSTAQGRERTGVGPIELHDLGGDRQIGDHLQCC